MVGSKVENTPTQLFLINAARGTYIGAATLFYSVVYYCIALDARLGILT